MNADSPGPETSRAIAVFGSSEPRPGEAAYEVARRLGALLADAGYSVITGGYGGVMEAASKGASERGGETVGVGCEIFAERSPNRYVGRLVMTSDLYARSRELIERADGYVILPGMAGTLSEISLLWALDRAGCLDGKPVIALGDCWENLVRELTRVNMLEPRQLRLTRMAATPEQAVDQLRSLVTGSRER